VTSGIGAPNTGVAEWHDVQFAASTSATSHGKPIGTPPVVSAEPPSLDASPVSPASSPDTSR
jgi:hypothetical protein